MKVKSVLALAAANLGREDLVAMINDCAGDAFGEIASLLRCYNLVENEVALDYFPLKREEKVCVRGGMIPFARLDYAPVTVLAVEEDGKPLSFELRPARILLPKSDGERRVTVVYSYSPKEKRFCDKSEFGGRISCRLLSFGVACEFCLTSGQYAEAATWEKKYREALRAANVLRKRLSVRSRRWV